MLNPNRYAIITGKNNWGIQTDRHLQAILQTRAWNLCLELEPLAFIWNPSLEPWNL